VSAAGLPLLTAEVHGALARARATGVAEIEVSLDLGRTTARVALVAGGWRWRDGTYPLPAACKERTVYAWDGREFVAVTRFSGSLIKLVPTEWGAPTFEIDGIKMLPSARVSPYEDARAKVALIAPRGKVVLDTCGGLGYFASWCLREGAARVQSYEKNADVIWLRSLNPWSPEGPDSGVDTAALRLAHGDVATTIADVPAASVDAILHDPPRFGIAGELYSRAFYAELARVIRRGGTLFHYTGAPNSVSRGRDLPSEVVARLRDVGFAGRPHGDGVLAVRRGA